MARAARTLSVDFRPSRDGLPFPNTWPTGAAVRIGKRALLRVYDGLCGGMAVLSRERWLAGEPIPASAAPTDQGLVDALVAAQVTSLRLPSGPLRYLFLQLPPRRAARRRSTALSLAAARADLAAGRPACVGLLRALSWNPATLSRHHVVLCYAVCEDSAHTILSVYDPNHARDDHVRLTVEADSSIRTNRRDPRPYALLPL